MIYIEYLMLIYLKDNEIWKKKILNQKLFIYQVILVDIYVFFLKMKKLLLQEIHFFHLGCGRIFEGTYEEMFNSLKKLKELPKETKIYCGHEYTLKNSEFCLKFDKDNKKIKKKISEIKNKIK